ncbi:unnamed protein product [Schistocephalus solidus]|uniref:CN hydrolase domain-containing protein n=1 Tax=Schistocephalus solidus TaxID=70667 RepID=A0A183S947_SCHSO|nr:unnamed protein product [Schistocephalus solidus]
MQTFVMRTQLDVAVDIVCVEGPNFEDFACLFGASHVAHFSSLPIEAVVAINGVRKHEKQRIASADGQFVFDYAGPESSTCMAYDGRFLFEDYFGIGVFSVDAGCELANMRADIPRCALGLLRKRKHQETLSMGKEKGLRSLRSDGSIVIEAADKGGATVNIDKIEYVNKANLAFDDREAYIPIAEVSTKKNRPHL